MTRYLERQIAWTQAVDAELAGIDAMPPEELEALTVRVLRWEKELDDFVREQHGLSHEWADGAGAAADDRARVAALSEQAKAVTRPLAARYAHAVEVLHQKRVDNVRAMNALRQSREWLSRYRPGGETPRTAFDTKA
jgi:hypothetical protein